jgi:hypothetical protein
MPRRFDELSSAARVSHDVVYLRQSIGSDLCSRRRDRLAVDRHRAKRGGTGEAGVVII